MATSIGMNLATVNYWGTEYAFLDHFKTSGAWGATDASWNALDTTISLDANGYVTKLPTGAARVTAAVSIEPASLDLPDRYVLLYEGTGTFKLNGSTIVSSEPGKIVFDHITDSNILQVGLTAISASDPVSEIHLVREDQLGLFQTGELFNPAFIEKTSQWDVLRFMDWGSTNNSDVRVWADRTTPNDASWAGTGDTQSVPIEVMVALANKTGVDMWYNIPAEVNDDFVRQTLTYIRDHLDAGLKLHLEYSNEVWNWGFDQSKYALTKGDQLWGKDTNGDGKINPNDPAEHVADGWLQYYGYRSAQIANISDQIFGAGADARVINVISTQPSSVTKDASVMAGAVKAGLGTVAQLFDDYAVTTYFGNGITLASENAADRALVLSWARTGELGKAAAFQEMEHGGMLASNNSLDYLAAIWAHHADVAEANGLRLVAYEGGAHLVADGYPGSQQAEITAFINSLMEDPRMGVLYQKMAAGFAAQGGVELTVYDDAAGSSTHGNWGVLDSIYDDGSPRYDALVAVQAAYVAASSPGLVLTGTAAADKLTGGANADRLSGLAGNDTLSGGAGADTLDGGTGNDSLDGGTGPDRLIGGDGNDIYRIDNAGDVIVETATGGIDQVYNSVSYVLGDDVENLRLSGGDAIDGTGNVLGNALYGNAGANHLYGMGGNDTFHGLEGNDTLDGGAGDDGIMGEDGDDSLVGGGGSDRLNGGNGDDILIGGTGSDTLTGGTGADRFAFVLADLTAVRTTTDMIADFAHVEGDRIDLSGIDAIAATGTNEAFRFIAVAAFSHAAGELRATAVGNDRYEVTGDINGDGLADFSLTVVSKAALVSSDFIL